MTFDEEWAQANEAQRAPLLASYLTELVRSESDDLFDWMEEMRGFVRDEYASHLVDAYFRLPGWDAKRWFFSAVADLTSPKAAPMMWDALLVPPDDGDMSSIVQATALAYLEQRPDAFNDYFKNDQATAEAISRLRAARGRQSFLNLLYGVGGAVQGRQLEVVGANPALNDAGWFVDVRGGAFVTADGTRHPMQIIGSEADGSFMWSWANPSLPPRLCRLAAQVRNYGLEHDITELRSPVLSLPAWDDQEELTGVNLSVVFSGLLQIPAYRRCAQGSRALYIALVSRALMPPPPPHPLIRMTTQLPQVWALSGRASPEAGGATLPRWKSLVQGWCASLGVECVVGEDQVLLRQDGESMVVAVEDGKMTVNASFGPS